MILFGVLATLALTALSATSAAAAVGHRPDGWVRYEGFHDGLSGTNDPNPGAWMGQNIYNTTALNQTATHKIIGASVSRKDYFYFTFTIQNDGASDRFKVKGGGGAGVKYFKGSTNITTQVEAGTYQTASLAAGARTTISVHILWASSVSSELVTLTSAADSTKKDAVKAALKAGGCGC
jgi:hypothetical protein